MHFLRIEFAFEMELISLFYKMYYNIRPGLGLQCVIVVFPDDTHLFLFVVENEFTCTTANRYRKCPGDAVFFLSFFFVLFKKSSNSSNSNVMK